MQWKSIITEQHRIEPASGVILDNGEPIIVQDDALRIILDTPRSMKITK
jgi:hypothetical protein